MGLGWNKMTAVFILFSLFFESGFSQELDYRGLPQWSWHKSDSTEYYLYTPDGMKAGEKYPVVLALHGCCGEDYHATLRNTVDPIVRMWHQFGKNKQDVPTYIIAPKTSKGWKQHFGNLKKVMDDLIANKQGDPKRIYVSGFSMGGEGTYLIIQQYPGYFAAAIPMGMSFTGDSTRVQNIPIWANQGETDWWSRFMKANVAGIRHLNGFTADTGATWVTGVNPRYSNFKGVGHGVQWNAASTQNLTGWAYSKINDGNIYPVVFFVSPSFGKYASEGKEVLLDIHAHDPDGRIAKVDIYLNGKFVQSLSRSPYQLSVKPVPGDNLLEAKAFDNKGKYSTAEIIVPVYQKTELALFKLLPAHAGSYFEMRFKSLGNADLIFSLADSVNYPQGMMLYPDGVFRGIPMQAGSYSVHVKVKSANLDSSSRAYSFVVESKLPEQVLITDVVTRDGQKYEVSVMKPGESPYFDSRDSSFTTDLQEVNFNDPAPFTGLSYIKTDINDANKSADQFLAFHVDEDVVVYIAYEKLDSLFHSTVPAWLTSYKKENIEVAAQYRYYEVYSRKFPKGTIVLPASDSKTNHVIGNYFVMIKKAN